MENQLTTWIHSKFATDILSKIIDTVKKTYLLNDYEVTIQENGISFMYDDNSTEEIQISIQELKDMHVIQIVGEYDWEVVSVYQLINELLLEIVEQQ